MRRHLGRVEGVGMRGRILVLLAVVTVLLSAIVAPPAASALNGGGSVDRAFLAANGIGFDSTVYALALQPDGRILAGGRFVASNRVRSTGLARLNADGSTDSAFARMLGTGFNGRVSAVTVQADGRILVGGDFTSMNSVATPRLVRLEPDGTIDAAFLQGLGTGSTGPVSAIVQQPDGRLLVGGNFASFNGGSSARLVRLNPDGTLDAGFSAALGAGFNDAVTSLAVQSNGRIVVGGRFTDVNGVSANRIARLKADGSVDASFSEVTGQGFNAPVTAIRIQPDGRILIGGSFTTFDTAASPRITRLSNTGEPDADFLNGVGRGFDGNVAALALQPDGSVVVGGSFTRADGLPSGRIARLGNTGVPDTAFSVDAGKGFDLYVYALIGQPDGGIIAGGNFTLANSLRAGRIARLRGVASPPGAGGVDPASGSTSGGTRVSVLGNLLAGATQVTFGEAPCTDLTVVDSGMLTCTTPPGPEGPVDVTITTPGGVVRLPAGYTYTPPAPQTLRPGSVPRSLAPKGTTVVNRAFAKTQQGQPISARVTVLAPARGAKNCVTVKTSRNRQVTVTLTGKCTTRIRVAYSAPATLEFAALATERVYATRKAR